ncbi:MAG TPA: sensor histidine kinase [Acidimicrobiia bacterium]|jgi:signal transduction histidine kinase
MGVFLRRYGFDLVLVVVILDGVFEVTSADAEVGVSVPQWVIVSGTVAIVLPLFARRRFPFMSPAMVWLIGAVFSFVEGRLAVTTFGVYVTGVIAAYLLGNLLEPARARTGLIVVLIGASVVVYNDPSRAASDFVTIPSTFAIAWLAGFALRARADRIDEAEQRAIAAERDRESAARIAVAEERSRITRELHDVVAHAVSVMVLQVGAVRHRLPGSMREDMEALKTVEDTGRSALTEMRRLLGVIHDDDRRVELSPQPGLDLLDTLVEEVRLAGLRVRLHRQGEPTVLPRAIDLSAYRIVQEGLTNCLKHARASVADVTVRHTSEDLEIEVVDDGVGPTTSDGLGRGITGIRERVKIYGGEMTTGPGPNGGFRLDVRLPIRGYPR